MIQSQTQDRARGWLAAVVLFLWHLPRNILIIILKLYRRVVSPIYGQVCRFFRHVRPTLWKP